ncbi:unnamed protein product [Medioppia subpectinata]|uniref:LIM zinc-binding domain-containing protein n=1 Tax=Medioppia subpectinata TaxID=1979941 RepID=A0A7R9KUY9_9ACAR|nr:unnamed protein product [Medioppia subpectinata]CAG2108976.1 unnamed protein product [Medioppia subpectinata]
MLLEKKPFSGKLEKVGKIEKNDFNFKPWNENTFFESKPRREAPPPPTLPNSRAILESRKNQMERKLEAKKAETRPEVKTKEWVEKMKEELTRRLGAREVAPLKCSSMPQCVRCGVDVSAVERISVCGHVLHRSCLRCSKCGISLRLNEFRNDLKFFCIFCLKNNSKIDSQIKAKEMFLKTNQKIDFRERIEFQNETQNEIEIINKTAVNEETTPDDEDDDQVLPFDNSSECDSTTSSDDDDSQEWETEDSEDDSEDDTDDGEDVSDDKRTTDTTTAIPSIRVTRETSDNKAFDDTNDDNNNDNCFRPEVRYLGSFTEKLFRSRSQPMIAFRNRLKIADKIADDDDMASLLTTLPFADDVFAAQHFSPVRAKAPIIDFEDI